MLKLLSVSVFFLFSLVGLTAHTEAASPIENRPTIPYEVTTINSQIEDKQVYLGELVGDPHTYEFSIGAKMDLVVNLAQAESGAEIVPFSLIVVKVNDNNRGVKEMGRVMPTENVWSSDFVSTFGISLSSAEPFSLELSPGIYRLEVSSAENSGKYMLTIGYRSTGDGYFSTLGDVRKIQSFFGYSFFRIFMSSYVFYPLGIIILSILFYQTWRNRNRLVNPSQDA